jgi:hypothetical protein
MTVDPSITPTSDAPVRARARERVLPLVATAFVLVAPWLLRGRLPDPVATHWGFDGRPDGRAPFVVDALLPVVLALLAATVPLRAAARADRAVARMLVATGHGLAALAVGLRVVTLRANLDAASWQDAGDVGGLTVLGMLVLAVVIGSIGWALAAWRPEQPVPARTVRPLDLAPGTSPVWNGRADGRFVALLPLLLIAVAVVVRLVVPAPGDRLAFVLLLVACLGALTSMHVTATVGPRGLTVRFGYLGAPRLRVPLERITAVRVEDVEPMRYGGWGYRMMPGVRAVVIRRGPGLRVERVGRPALVVTVDDADRGAALLTTLIARAPH